MSNVAIPNHSLLGETFTYRPDRPAYDPSADTEPGTLILGNGMSVVVVSVFRNWNGVEGLDMLYVYVPRTAMHTHVTPADLAITRAV